MMTCYQHPDLPALAFCRSCGRGLCVSCQHLAQGTVFCQEHAPLPYNDAPHADVPPPVDAAPNPYLQPPRPTAVHTSPGLAFLLGLIPGVGAIYNGQYLKGFTHVAVLGILISMISTGHPLGGGMTPLLGLLVAGWYFYMPFEAFHTAKRQQMGMRVDEWSSLLPRGATRERLPVGPVVMIVLGILFLLDNLGLLRLGEVLRYWPLILIVIGVASLYSRLSAPFPVVPPPPPVSADAPASSQSSANVMGVKP
jgi:hypothetical protein